MPWRDGLVRLRRAQHLHRVRRAVVTIHQLHDRLDRRPAVAADLRVLEDALKLPNALREIALANGEIRTGADHVEEIDALDLLEAGETLLRLLDLEVVELEAGDRRRHLDDGERVREVRARQRLSDQFLSVGKALLALGRIVFLHEVTDGCRPPPSRNPLDLKRLQSELPLTDVAPAVPVDVALAEKCLALLVRRLRERRRLVGRGGGGVLVLAAQGPDRLHRRLVVLIDLCLGLRRRSFGRRLRLRFLKLRLLDARAPGDQRHQQHRKSLHLHFLPPLTFSLFT